MLGQSVPVPDGKRPKVVLFVELDSLRVLCRQCEDGAGLLEDECRAGESTLDAAARLFLSVFGATRSTSGIQPWGCCEVKIGGLDCWCSVAYFGVTVPVGRNWQPPSGLLEVARADLRRPELFSPASRPIAERCRSFGPQS